jgi:hypothetical protein
MDVPWGKLGVLNKLSSKVTADLLPTCSVCPGARAPVGNLTAIIIFLVLYIFLFLNFFY